MKYAAATLTVANLGTLVKGGKSTLMQTYEIKRLRKKCLENVNY